MGSHIIEHTHIIMILFDLKSYDYSNDKDNDDNGDILSSLITAITQTINIFK